MDILGDQDSSCINVFTDLDNFSLKIENENDEQVIQIDGLQINSQIKVIYDKIREKVEFEFQESDLFILMDNVPPIHEN